MANNRGEVPMYQGGAQYSATISPQVPQGSPAMFGTSVAKETAGLGDALSKMGTNLVDHAVKMQEKANNAYILQVDNEMRKQMNYLLYNPNTGLANQKGHNAQGITIAFDEELDRMTEQSLANLNPIMQQKLQERVAQWSMGYRRGIAVHEGNEIFAANKTDIDTNIQDRIDNAMRFPSAAGAKTLHMSLAQNVVDIQNVLGMSKEAAEEYVQEKYSAAVMQMAIALSGRDDTQGLLDLQRETEGLLSADASGKLAAITGKTQSRMTGVELAQPFLNDPKYKNPDGTRNFALIQRDFAKKHGVGSTRTERVFVGGGAYFSNQSVNADIMAASQEFGVDPALVAAIAEQESNGKQSAVSSVGATGVMQLMPDTAAGLGVDANNQRDNIRGGAKYIKQMLDKYNGNLDLALAAYNAGPGNVGENEQNGRVPNFKETQNYVQKVKLFYERNKSKGTADTKLDPSIDASGVKIEGTRPETIAMVNRAAQIYKQLFGRDDFWLSSTVTGHDAGTPHALGYKADVGGSALEESYENRIKFQQALQAEGIGANNEYDQPSENSTGGHFDLDVRGKNWQTGENFGGFKVSTAGHWEERTVSAYNETAYNEGLRFIKEQCEASKAEHDVNFDNALNDALGKVKSLRMPSEVDNLAHSYGLSETDSKRLYNVLLGARVDLADENQRYTDDQKAKSLRKQAEADAADNFYAWWNDNPNASNTEIQTKAADYGVSARFMHSINSAISKSKSSKNGWFTNSYNKRVFNNAVQQNGLKGEQVSNAMDIVTQKEAEKGAPLSPDEITTIVNKASAETVIYEGKWYEKDISGRAVDYPGGVIGKDRNGIDVTNEDGQNIVAGIDEDDFEE